MIIRVPKPNTPAFDKNVPWIVSIVVTILSALGLYTNIFSYLALLVSLVFVFILPEEQMLKVLMFIMPFANIFKPNPDAQSFFTYTLLVFILYSVIKKRKYNITFFAILIFLMMFLTLQMILSMHLLRTIKFIVYILFIFNSSSSFKQENSKGIYISYIGGIFTSSLLALLNVLPNVNRYVGSKSFGLEYDNLSRFKGLYGDPNYYSINVIISLCLIVILYHNKQIKKSSALILSACLVYFIALTYSKSSFLMLVLPLILLLYSSIKNRKYFIFLVVIIVSIFFLFGLFAGKIELFNVVLERFSESEDIASLTTSRSSIWANYINYFKTNPMKFLFGSGFNAKLVGGKGAHNTYIDALFYLGLVGTILYVAILVIIFKNTVLPAKRNLLNYSVIVTVGIMYFFLSELFYSDLPFHITLAIFVLKTDIAEIKLRRKRIR